LEVLQLDESRCATSRRRARRLGTVGGGDQLDSWNGSVTMPTLRGISHRLRTLIARRAADAETLEELADHLERQTRKHIAAGMSESEAARLARIELGGVQRWRDETAEARVGWRLSGFIGDCKYALRSLRRRPGFATIA